MKFRIMFAHIVVFEVVMCILGDFSTSLAGPREKHERVVSGQLTPSTLHVDVDNYLIVSNRTGPADWAIAVGPSHVVMVSNEGISIRGKGAGSSAGPMYSLESVLSSHFPLVPRPAGSFFFDPRVIYDQSSHRFVVSMIYKNDATTESRIYFLVSDSDDAAGDWDVVWFDSDVLENLPYPPWTLEWCWPDFPNIATDNDAMYLTANATNWTEQFGLSTVQCETVLWIIAKTDLFAGVEVRELPQPETFHPFGPSRPLASNLTPAMMIDDQDHSTGALLISPLRLGTARLLWVIEVIQPLGPNVTFVSHEINMGIIDDFDGGDVPPANQPPAYGIEQLPLHTGGEDGRRIQTAMHKNGILWGCDQVRQLPGEPGAGLCQAHWWKVSDDRQTTLTFSLLRQGVLDPSPIGPGVSTFYPSISVNDRGDFAVVCSASGPSTYVSTFASVFLGAAPPTAAPTTSLLYPGTSTYVHLDPEMANRWGDYLGVAADPANPSDFWAFAGAARVTSGAPAWNATLSRIQLSHDRIPFPSPYFADLNAAITAAAPGDTVEVAAGTAVSGTVNMKSGVAVCAALGEKPTINAWGGDGVVFPLDSTPATILEGFRIINIGSNGASGAVLPYPGGNHSDATITLRNCDFIGGENGVWSTNARVDLNRCTFSGQSGRAIHLEDAGPGTPACGECAPTLIQDCLLVGPVSGSPASSRGMDVWSPYRDVRIATTTCVGWGRNIELDGGNKAVSIEQSIVAHGLVAGIQCGDVATTTLDHNLFWANGPTGAMHRTCGSISTDNIVSDPQFCDLSTGFLNGNSPCLGANQWSEQIGAPGTIGCLFGTLASNVTLNSENTAAGSQILVKGDVVVPSGKMLSVHSPVDLIISSGDLVPDLTGDPESVELNIAGDLSVVGTETDLVEIRGATGSARVAGSV